MKALLYKEFRLSMHPICYIFIAVFPLMILIPSYPIAIGFIYVLTCYPILFLGANKGQQSNDLLYSTLLPVRKKDIVLARVFTVVIIQIVFIALMSCFYPLALSFQDSAKIDTGTIEVPGLPLSGYVSVLAIAIIGFAIADSIFFPIYYKNGKSIVLSTLLMILGFVVYIAIFTIALPYIPGLEGYTNFLCNSGLGIQFGLLGGAILVSIAVHYFTYIVSAKRLEKVDF